MKSSRHFVFLCCLLLGILNSSLEDDASISPIDETVKLGKSDGSAGESSASLTEETANLENKDGSSVKSIIPAEETVENPLSGEFIPTNDKVDETASKVENQDKESVSGKDDVQSVSSAEATAKSEVNANLKKGPIESLDDGINISPNGVPGSTEGLEAVKDTPLSEAGSPGVPDASEAAGTVTEVSSSAAVQTVTGGGQDDSYQIKYFLRLIAQEVLDLKSEVEKVKQDTTVIKSILVARGNRGDNTGYDGRGGSSDQGGAGGPYGQGFRSYAGGSSNQGLRSSSSGIARESANSSARPSGYSFLGGGNRGRPSYDGSPNGQVVFANSDVTASNGFAHADSYSFANNRRRSSYDADGIGSSSNQGRYGSYAAAEADAFGGPRGPYFRR